MLQRTTKNLTLDCKLLKACAKELLTLKQQYSNSFSTYIQLFCEEALILEASSKNYTPERSAKLSAYIDIYFSENPIVKSESIKQLSREFATILQKNEVHALYSKYTIDIYSLLQNTKKISYMNAEVHFIDNKQRESLLQMFTSMDKLLTSKTLLQRFSLSKVINFLNPDVLSYRYLVKYIAKYQYIKKPESIERYLPATYEVWKNSTKKYFNTFISTHKFDENTKKRLIQEHETELLRAKEEYEYITQNIEDLDVRILGYEDASLYPRISFTCNKYTTHKHLKSEMPNVLWFAHEAFRTNMEAKEFIETSQSAFGDVYYKFL